MILCDAPHKRIMFLSVSSSRIGTRFLFIDSKSWRRFERRRKILSRHSEKWKMDRFLHVEERGKNFPSCIDCFPRGESSASARVVDSKIFFLKNRLANETGRRLSNSRYHWNTWNKRVCIRVCLFLLFFIHRYGKNIFPSDIFQVGISEYMARDLVKWLVYSRSIYGTTPSEQIQVFSRN